MNTMTVPLDAAALAQRAAAGGDDFFRHHGVWSPGVRLFRNLRFKTKALVVSISFAVPLALVGYHWFTAQSEAIAFSVKERLGIEYAQAAMTVMPLAQTQRRIAVRGPDADPAALAAVQAELASALKALAGVHARLGAEIGTEAAYKAMLAAGMAVAAPAVDTERVFASHSAYVSAVIALVTAAADGSNLTLDPDLNTYYLMDAAFAATPMLAEVTGRLRGLGSAAAASGKSTPAVARQLAGGEALGKEFAARLQAALAKVLTVHPALAKPLDASMALAAMNQLLDHVAVGSDAAAILASGNTAVAGFLALQKTAAVELDKLVQERISSLETRRSAAAAREIKALIDSSVLKTESGAKVVAQAGNTMQSIVEAVQRINALLGEVTIASDQQTQGISDVNATVSQLDKSTQQNAALVEQASAAAQSMNQQANSLTAVVAHFKLPQVA